MGAITATIEPGDDVLARVADMLRHFPKGSRVRVDITEATSNEATLSAEEYRLMVEAARRAAPEPPWPTTAAAMAALREGELD